MLNAVGIDVSKGKSTVTVLQPGGVVVRKPFDVYHNKEDLQNLVTSIQSLDGDTRVVLECTGRYHLPIVNVLLNNGIYVSAVNPHLIKNFGNNTIRKIKTDPADAKKIARYTLDNWSGLREYSAMDQQREALKSMNTQFHFLMKQKVAAKVNLVSLLDLTYPGANKLLTSPERDDGSQKWVDFAYTFWHVDCVRKLSRQAFHERYHNFCKHHHYEYQEDKVNQIYDAAKQLISPCGKSPEYKLLIQSSIRQLKVISENVEMLRKAMDDLASKMPEYDTVLNMYGIGHTYGPQLIAEIGDVSRFTHREALTAFAGVDPGKAQSGNYNRKSNPSSKCGSARLRKTLFQIMSTLLQTKPANDPVYLFMDKKRREGKPYLVYMTAGANKFLRIYYGKVKEHLRLTQSQK